MLSQIGHAQALAEMSAAHVGRKRYLLGQFCWAWAVISQDQNTEEERHKCFEDCLA